MIYPSRCKIVRKESHFCIVISAFCVESLNFFVFCANYSHEKKTHHPVALFTRLLTDIDSGVKAGEGSPGLISDVSQKPHHCTEVT